MKFILVLSIVLAALSRKTNLKSKTKGNVDYKPVLIDGFSHSDAVAAIMIRKSHFSKKLELNHMVIIHIAKRLTKRLTKNIDLIVNKILILKKG